MSYSQIPGHFSIKSTHFPLLHERSGYTLLILCSWSAMIYYDFLICWKHISLWSRQFVDDKNRNEEICPQSIAKAYYLNYAN
jgi:hypothetical protein